MTQHDSDLPAIQEPLNRPQRGMLSLLNLSTGAQSFIHREDAPETIIHNFVRYYYHGTMDGIAQYTTDDNRYENNKYEIER